MDPHPALDPALLEILVCPGCHAALVVEQDAGDVRTLRCTSSGCGLVYPVRDGIPIMLVDEAISGSAPESGEHGDDH
jgi:uncharacterized protein YbaR (Trm112 family)